ncbi:hypothetical protein BpHYR1_030469 [Brachionus plicatilis]|uniref:Uncharacterized protein n=1 Tax=Brachionus plicatilis TaxID=10195 RepID=A0A3M7RWT5_BRAPC|nr:hypothetical protein BpHYR1_030469 [Brachionus plicatilis]
MDNEYYINLRTTAKTDIIYLNRFRNILHDKNNFVQFKRYAILFEVDNSFHKNLFLPFAFLVMTHQIEKCL